MTYLSLVKCLTEFGAAAPTHEAAELVRVLTGKPREWCIMHRDEALPSSIDTAVIKRMNGIPLQYILGEAWFYGHRFIVSPDCLIPQPDTEHLVMLTLERIGSNANILDLCTGSGCIAVSVLKENTSASATAVDISDKALSLAKRNAKLHEVYDRIIFIEADILTADTGEIIKNADVIVSNPPYISTSVIATLSAEVRCEPSIALDGGADGMIFYRRFINDLTKHMKQDAVMLLEIGYDQSEQIAELCRLQRLNCRFHKDFGGNIRVAEITRNNHSPQE
ncbi:MAG: peptide chain release factor N(5)-glutamine methyltransferase [Clostridia bacterium]|nr:peptide chain release factor N(5)-glutamine methyltransferase [Clostridia bacterium]